VFMGYGNVWCPWEVGRSKERRAGSNPVTSVLKNHHMRIFLCKLEYYFVSYLMQINMNTLKIQKYSFKGQI